MTENNEDSSDSEEVQQLTKEILTKLTDAMKDAVTQHLEMLDDQFGVAGFDEELEINEDGSVDTAILIESTSNPDRIETLKQSISQDTWKGNVSVFLLEDGELKTLKHGYNPEMIDKEGYQL